MLSDSSWKEQAKISFLVITPKYTRRIVTNICQLFQTVLHYNSGQAQPKIINTNFCVLVGLLLTERIILVFKTCLDFSLFHG